MSPRLSWGFLLAVLGVALWIQPVAAKIERFTDPAGTLHISNDKEGESGKPGGPPTLPGQPQAFPPPTLPTPIPPAPEPVAPPTEGQEGEMEILPAGPEAVQEPPGQPPAPPPGQEPVEPQGAQ